MIEVPEKRGAVMDFGQNAAMAIGTELEPEARRRYMLKTERDVRPAFIFFAPVILPTIPIP